MTDEEVAALDERHLPIYTILVPLYKEAGIVPRLVRDINALDYPRTRLDVKLLCEEDDDETIAKIRELAASAATSTSSSCPDSKPKTKPKACNYGLQLATGKYCVIFDAEDRPDPDQLKKALIAFEPVPEQRRVHAGQAQPLQPGPEHADGLVRQRVLDALRAGAARDGCRRSRRSRWAAPPTTSSPPRLRELGAWDPFNVTEDADLGIRLHRAGYRTAMIDSTTWRRPTPRSATGSGSAAAGTRATTRPGWCTCATRSSCCAETGLRGFLSFNLTMGTAFVLLLNPIFWGLTTLYVLTQWGFIEQLFPGIIFYAASALLFVGNFLFVYLNVAGSLQRGEFSITRTALLSPLYWGLMSWAAWKGFIQLFTNPFYWEKTEHGLDEGHS